jgi:FkbM family methyltransferase
MPPFPASSPFELPIANRVDPAPGRWLRIAVHERSETVSNILRHHFTWQRALTVFIDRFLKPGDVFVDVGANLGYFTLVGANAVGRAGRVHSFEPEPHNMALLRRNLSLNGFGQVVCHEVAVGATSGVADLSLSETNLGAHHLAGPADRGDTLQVPLVTLEEALADEARPINLVKIDIQGGELDVLAGMAALLARPPGPPALLMEFNPAALEDADPGLERFQAFVARHGYRVHGFIANERAGVRPPPLSMETLLALHRDLLAERAGGEFDILLAPGR